VPSGTSRNTIKDYIVNLWGTPDKPAYVLLVGDTDGSVSTSNTIPHWIGQGSRQAATDWPYVCMDPGDDWHPEIPIGRFSVRSPSMLQDVVDKTLFVEAGNYPDPNYVKRAAFLATSDMTSGAEETHDWVIETFMEPAEFNCTRIYARLGGGTQDITNAVNNGCLFVTYGGHSGSSGWSSPSFHQDNVEALSNAGLYGLVFGWSCNTAHYSYDECFGETWQRVANRGAAAYLSASDYIYWGDWEAWEPSRQLERYFFKSFFVDDIWEVGPAWVLALYRFLNDYGSVPGHEDVTRNFFEMFILLGDPSLLLPKGVAFTLQVDPVSQSLCSPPADEAVYTIDVQQHLGFDEPVTLSAGGAPPGSSISFDVNGQVPPFTSVMTISDITGGSPGDYQIEIQGTSTSMERTVFVDLDLSSSVPGGVTLLSPPNGAVDVARRPTLTWTPATQAVEYDLEIATDSGFANVVYSATSTETSHDVTLNLDGATLYYWHVGAVNGCGEGDYSTPFSFTTIEQPDYFTEEFVGDFDLDYFTVYFAPDGSGDYYDVCIEEATEFPTDPTGGTVVSLSEDRYEHVSLSDGQTVQLYGISYSGFWICDNGYITFTGGDTDYTESLSDHFSIPRISPLFDDLSAPAGGTISWQQLEDRAVATYEDVPEWNTSNHNTFQVEMFFDGEIHITWLRVDSGDSIVGLSEGIGLPDDYIESDLSASGPCGDDPPIAENGSAATVANTPVDVTLTATDDGQPDPPGALSYIVVSLPEHGTLSDPGADVIETVPYTLVGGGNEVTYTPDIWYIGADSFTFKANDGGVPPEGGDSNVAVISIDVAPPAPEQVYSYPLDGDPGWSTEGQWAFGQPTGGGSHYGDPASGYTGDTVYGYNLSGDYTVNMPAYYLTTTAIDCSDLQQVELRFWRWLGVERSPFDHAVVDVSADRTNWTAVWANPTTTVSDSAWSQMSFDISAVADYESSVYVRWGIGPTDESTTYPGWNIDDVEIWAVVLPQCPGDLDGDGDIDLNDLSILLAHYGMASGAAYSDGDLDGDGDVDLNDLTALLAAYGTTCG
jgi:hypothetical protein